MTMVPRRPIATPDDLVDELHLTRELVRHKQLEALKQLRQTPAAERIGCDAVL